MALYHTILIIHIATAFAFAMTLIIMQLVVFNVMNKIPESSGKNEGRLFIQKRWHPVVDIIIILLGMSAAYLFYYNYHQVTHDNLLLIKVITGFTALLSAYLNHFCFRYIKRRLTASGKDPERLKFLGSLTSILDKTALAGAVITIFLGLYINHYLF